MTGAMGKVRLSFEVDEDDAAELCEAATVWCEDDVPGLLRQLVGNLASWCRGNRDYAEDPDEWAAFLAWDPANFEFLGDFVRANAPAFETDYDLSLGELRYGKQISTRDFAALKLEDGSIFVFDDGKAWFLRAPRFDHPTLSARARDSIRRFTEAKVVSSWN